MFQMIPDFIFGLISHSYNSKQNTNLIEVQMWNLFSTVQPKVILPAKSLKEQLLQQEEKALSFIEQEINKILTSINQLLKPTSSQPQAHTQSQNLLIHQLQSTVCSLEHYIHSDNLKFQDYITYRDQQKINQQQFFKQTLRSYEFKKSQLNHYIQELQDKVQALQLQGLKTYQLNPKPNNVLGGISHDYQEKYMNKLQELKKIQQNLQSFALKNKNKTLKAKTFHSTTQFTHLKQNKPNTTLLIQSNKKLNTLNDLQKELEMILLKEQVVGEILDKNIKQCKTNFQSLAHQQNSLKQSMKKMGIICEEKKKMLTKNIKSSRGFSQFHELSSLKKTSSFSICKPQPNNLNPSIDSKQPQNETIEVENQIDYEEELQNQEQVPSKNFIQACEFLITERFIGDDEEKDHNEELCEPQIQN